MSRSIKFSYFVADFETTSYEGQTRADVWASAIVPLYSEDVYVFNSIKKLWLYIKALEGNICVFFHNLKFDGEFWLPFLLDDCKFKPATMKIGDEEVDLRFIPTKYMQNNTFTYTISNMGQWYIITIKEGNRIIEIRDSLKLLPFSVKKIGKSFGTKRRKTEIEYVGYREPNGYISDQEKQYIANDVLVVKEALEIMFDEGHTSLTIGSCCLKEYRNIVGAAKFKEMFPNIYDTVLDEAIYGSSNAGEYVRKAYRGGWCYLVEGKEKLVLTNGTTADVNSLYPSVMHSESGGKYPVYNPHFWSGDYIPDNAIGDDKFYFIRIRTRFYLKEGMLPHIQIKRNPLYKGNESLKSSDVRDPKTGVYHKFYTKGDEIVPARVELTINEVDFKLMQDHYELTDFEILDGCWFFAKIGIFDDYINKYAEIKKHSKGARRELAKLFLNNLYGKMSSTTNSSFKYAYLDENGVIKYRTILANDKRPGFIPVGCAITSYARNFTIRAAQKNFYGKDHRGFCYADTDSIHCDLPPEKLKGIMVHPTNFCCWKLESEWDFAFFTRQKTYIEHNIKEDGEPCTPYYNIKCAGMPEKCKTLFNMSVEGWDENDEETQKFISRLTPEQIEFINTKRSIEDFREGLCISGKLMPKRIQGGIVLVDTVYEMRGFNFI